MPAKDILHNQVRHALEKNDWTITHDPLSIRTGGVEYHIDLGAERLIAAEKNGEKIAVEIKSFVGMSTISEFHTALGQYMEYIVALEDTHPSRILYLAVPIETYNTFFALQFIQRIIQRYKLKLLVYDEEQETIVTWKK